MTFRSPTRRSLSRVLVRGVAFASALCALSLLIVPLLLALLMLLFDSTAQGLMVLLGTIAGWFRDVVPGGSDLPAYRSLALDPRALALGAAARMVPCMAGTLAVLTAPSRRPAWGAAALCWLVTAFLCGGTAPTLVLLPGLLVAVLAATGAVAIDDGRGQAA